MTDKLPLEKDGKRLTRRFLGELFPTCTDHSNELKAYKKGHTHYFFKNKGVRIGHKKMKLVRQEYFYV